MRAVPNSGARRKSSVRHRTGPEVGRSRGESNIKGPLEKMTLRNVLAMASNLVAMASNLVAMASNLVALASTLLVERISFALRLSFKIHSSQQGCLRMGGVE